MSDRAPIWGISPVPDRLRTLGALENGMLWSSLGLSLLVLVAGAFLVPALSLPKALLAILVGGIFGNRSEEHTSELQSQSNLVCRLLLEKKKHTPSSYILQEQSALANSPPVVITSLRTT